MGEETYGSFIRWENGDLRLPDKRKEKGSTRRAWKERGTWYTTEEFLKITGTICDIECTPHYMPTH